MVHTDHRRHRRRVFRTDAPAHRWLAETVFVGLAREEDGHVCIRFYALD